ncbi:hypothetical protein ADK55_34070 [Streptomyces sp. WM4235]|uniref:DUF6406 domain-containing protein n=1 Tax=Streptomyces sp. WM4235 TaxID=1415551 RepID=UPI0006B02865|nr:DUF6406 domain-containing protein [Streptomyces sp. WM4235]KOU39008.1 hypothetical protein ADK55_34070 [Streptomyces sp. WM4235]
MTFIAGHVHAPEGTALSFSLCVVANGEHKYTLRIGDTFPVRGETRALDRVENRPDSGRWAVLTKVLTNVDARVDAVDAVDAPDAGGTPRRQLPGL